MIDMSRLKARLRVSEGWRSKMYLDTRGKRTIGYGHNLDANGISRRASEIILEDDVQTLAIQPLDAILPWWRAMSGVRQSVLADMCFNMGIGTLLTFINTLAAMERGDYRAAAYGMRHSAWYKQVGNRAEVLARMMETGEDLN